MGESGNNLPRPMDQQLVLEPDPSGEEEGSGHFSTFNLSPCRTECWPGQSVANGIMEMVFHQAAVLPTTRYGKSLCCFMFHPSTWGKQWADWQRTYTWSHNRSL